MTETFSREDVLCILGDDDYEAASELRELFEAEAQRIVAEIEQAVDRQDDAGVARAAHTLKSVAANVGGRATRALATAIEAAARVGDRQEIARLSTTLASEVTALRAALTGFVSELQPRATRP